MPAHCEPVSPATEAVDVFTTSSQTVNLISISFGTATVIQDDFSDILRSPAVEQEVLDILDE